MFRIISFALFVLFVAPFEVAAQDKPKGFFLPGHRIQGVGVDRETVAAIGLKDRTVLAVYAQRFWIMKHPEARDAPRRIFEGPLWKIIQSAAKAQKIEPLLLASRIFLESWGICTARSSSAVGCAQFTVSGGMDEGLVKIERQRVGQGKKAHWTNVIVRDDRLKPELAIPAMARRIKRQTEAYGRPDFEVAEYHMGYGNMLKALSLYTGEHLDPKKTPVEDVRRLIERKGLSYPLVFFNNSPRYKPALFAHFKGLSDFSPNYYFRVQAASDLLAMYQKNHEEYARSWEEYRPKFPGRD